MNKYGDGGPAFPSHGSMMGEACDQGMTLRDYFAARFAQTLLAADFPHYVSQPAILARDAMTLADAMLAERSKP